MGPVWTKKRGCTEPITHTVQPQGGHVRIPPMKQQSQFSLVWVNQHQLMHQLWMRLFWPFWDEPKPFNPNQTLRWVTFFFFSLAQLSLRFQKTSPPFSPSSSFLFFSFVLSFFFFSSTIIFFFSIVTVAFFSSFVFLYCYNFFIISFFFLFFSFSSSIFFFFLYSLFFFKHFLFFHHIVAVVAISCCIDISYTHHTRYAFILVFFCCGLKVETKRKSKEKKKKKAKE